MSYFDLWDTLGLVGLLLIVAGVGMLNVAAAIIVAGVALVVVAVQGAARSNGISGRSAKHGG